MFLNTIAYQSIKKKEMISLDGNEALVVYKQDVKSNQVKQHIKYGPTLFMPLANEWYVQVCFILWNLDLGEIINLTVFFWFIYFLYSYMYTHISSIIPPHW